MAKLVILESAQQELNEIVQLHMNLVGPNSARSITKLIYDVLSQLETFPLSGHMLRDKTLQAAGYRYVIVKKYICVYRLVEDTVVVYHIAHGSTDYPTFIRWLKKQ